jgi:arylsulfatase A-like enzyme
MPIRPNVLFVIIDQLRADCLFGRLADHVELPNLRRLMSESVTFRRHYSVANPCGPSRASILTGQYAMNHRSIRNGTPLGHDTPNLATEMRKAGYLPLLFGYTDTTQDPGVLPPGDPTLKTYEQVMPGFQEVVEMRLEESQPWRAHLMAKGYDVPPYPEIFRPNGPRLNDSALYRAEDSDSAFLTDRAILGLMGRKPGWFAHLTYIRPHPPLVAPAPYNRMYDPSALPLPVRLASVEQERARHPFIAPGHSERPMSKMVEGFDDLQETDENAQILRATYLGLATEVDHHIGRVFEYLRESGQYDDTLILVTSDHGEMLGDHYAWGKTTFYDAAYHTPLIIRDPQLRVGAGTVCDLPTESVDITPTILDRLGLPVPHDINGKSLLPFLSGQTPPDWKSHSYSELDFGEPGRPTTTQHALGLSAETSNLAILRSARYTLVHFNGELAPLLFDHQGDGEMRDLAGDEEFQTVLLEMYRIMVSHRMSHARSRFTWTTITPEGVLQTPRT